MIKNVQNYNLNDKEIIIQAFIVLFYHTKDNYFDSWIIYNNDLAFRIKRWDSNPTTEALETIYRLGAE